MKFENHRKICTICAGETLLRFASLQHWINFGPLLSHKHRTGNSQTDGGLRHTCVISSRGKTGALTCRRSGRIPCSCLPCSPGKTVAADWDPPLRHRTEGSRGCEGCPSRSSPLSQQVEKVWPQKIEWTGLPRWRRGRESRRWMIDLLRWRRLRCDRRRCRNHTVGWTRRSLLHRKWCCYLRYREGKMLTNSGRWEWNRSNCKHSRWGYIWEKMLSFYWRRDTCAPGWLWALRMLLVIVGLQDVAVLGHHEDRDEVNDSKSQKLGLLTVLLKQTKFTKRPGPLWLRYGRWVKFLNAALGWLLCSTHNISEDNSPEAVDVHILKQPVQIPHWRHSTCHCVHWTLRVWKSTLS